MDSKRKSASSNKKATALLIAESFAHHDLRPLTLSVPTALLPIHNTPLLDFHLENLVRNRINEVYVVGFKNYKKIWEHLNCTRTSTGKCWTESNEIKVIPVEGSEKVSTLYEAFQEIVHKNIVPEHFIFITLDTICTLNNLRDLYNEHVERAETVPKLVLTMVSAQGSSLLRDTMNAVGKEYDELCQHQHHGHHHKSKSSSQLPGYPPETPVTTNQFVAGAFDFDRRESDCIPKAPPVNYMTVAYDTKTSIVKQYKKWLPERDDNNTISFSSIPIVPSSKVQLKVRTDLEQTGIFICSQETTNVFAQFMPDFSELLEDLLANQEVNGNNFCIDFASHESCTRHISSFKSYVDLNIDATARFLHPMTRSSNFAEPNSFYSCSHRHLSSVFIHFDKDPALHCANVGPRVVVGPKCTIAATAKVRDCVLGRNVRIGEKADLVGCVIMDDVLIADGATLRYSVIGPDVKIGRNAMVSPYCVVGRGTRVDHSKPLTVPQGSLIYVPETDAVAKTQAAIVGDHGRGAIFDPEAPEHDKGALGIARKIEEVTDVKSLFVSDALPNVEEEEDEDIDDAFRNFIRSQVEVAIKSPSNLDHVFFEMKQARVSYATDNNELIKVATKFLLQIFAQKMADAPEKKTPKEALKALKVILNQWEEPFYEAMMKNATGDGGDEAIDALLTGLSLGMHYEPISADGDEEEAVNLLHSRADHIMAFFYTSENDVISELMTKNSVLAFDDFMTELSEDDPTMRTEEDEKVLEGWGHFENYVTILREESDEEEESEED